MRKPAINGTRRSGAVRCAIYTRKSSEEGLEQEFNSLQAQREACEAFIDSQRHEGCRFFSSAWRSLPPALLLFLEPRSSSKCRRRGGGCVQIFFYFLRTSRR